MRIKTTISITVCLSFFLLFPWESQAEIKVGISSQINKGVGGAQPGGVSQNAQIGATGKQIVFVSNAKNLVANDTSSANFNQVFRRDPRTAVISRASVTSSGGESDGNAIRSAVSQTTADGLYAVAFSSNAPDLGGLDLTPLGYRTFNIFVRLPTLGITELMTPGLGYVPAEGYSDNPSVTVVPLSDGRNKVLVTYSSNSVLTVGSSLEAHDVFLSEFIVPKTSKYTASSLVTITKVSNSMVADENTNGTSDNPKISADGRYIVYASDASNLVDLGGQFGASAIQQIYLYDVKTKVTTLVSKTSAGIPGDANSYTPTISFNGRYVTFLTDSTNLYPGSVGDRRTVLWMDLEKGITRRMNESNVGEASSGLSFSASMSPNGRLVAFADTGSNLIADDTNDNPDIFVKDTISGEVARVSVGPNGAQADHTSNAPVIASDTFNGTTSIVAFESAASNLDAQGFPNSNYNIFTNTVTIPAPPLVAGTELDIPPDVKVNSKTLVFTAQKFTAGGSAAEVEAASRAKIEVRYQFEIIRTYTSGGKKRNARVLQTSKRNTLTVAKQKGTYNVRNNVVTVRVQKGKKDKTVVKTGFTPRQTFTVK